MSDIAATSDNYLIQQAASAEVSKPAEQPLFALLWYKQWPHIAGNNITVQQTAACNHGNEGGVNNTYMCHFEVTSE